MSGVPLEQLCCPTCGSPFGREVRHEEPEEEFQVFQTAITLSSPSRPYLRCWRGHKWTIKELTRIDGAPDEILLGQLIGID